MRIFGNKIKIIKICENKVIKKEVVKKGETIVDN